MTQAAEIANEPSRTHRVFGAPVGLLALAALVLLAFAFTFTPASAGAAPPQLWQKCDSDEPVDQQCGGIPRGIAADPETGNIYLADAVSNRINEFTVWGEFVRAWGWGVVASGPNNDPQNEIQEVSVDATGGSFSIRFFFGNFNNEVTASQAFDASAAALQSALEALGSLDPGDVSVSGPAGGPWSIEFTGKQADADIAEVEVVNSTLSGPGTSTVATVQDGANFEVCVVADGDACRNAPAGQMTPQATTPSEPSAARPGQLFAPQGLALDSAGDLYVVDRSFRRIQKFDLSGSDPTFEWMVGGGVNQGPNNPGNLCSATHIAGGDTCGPGSPGPGPGQFGADLEGGSSYIAVNTNDTATSADDTVYVGDENRIEKFDTDGDYTGEIAFTGDPLPEPGIVQSLAVDPASGDLYFSYRLQLVNFTQAVQPGVHRLDAATGEVLDTLDVPTPTAVATAANGHVYAYQDDNPFGGPPSYEEAILEFDAAGNQVDYFETAPLGFTVASTGLATSSACGIPGTQLYVSGRMSGTDFLRAYGPAATDTVACPPPTAAPSVVHSFASSADTEQATLKAKINPHFWNDTTYRVEYGSEGPCSDPGNACTEQPAAPGTQLTTVVVDASLDAEVSLAGLQPATTYHYRFVAQSSGGGPTFGPDLSFTTFPEPNPNASCPNQAFRTDLPSAHLPDCRAYELVSPLDKTGGDIGTNQLFAFKPLALYQAATDGQRITYGSFTAFGEPESAPLYSQLLSARDPGAGWFNPLDLPATHLGAPLPSPQRAQRPSVQDLLGRPLPSLVHPGHRPQPGRGRAARHARPLPPRRRGLRTQRL